MRKIRGDLESSSRADGSCLIPYSFKVLKVLFHSAVLLVTVQESTDSELRTNYSLLPNFLQKAPITVPLLAQTSTHVVQ